MGADLTRRQAAILVADAAGYSRLMASDGPGTVAALDTARETFRRQIATQGGQVVDMAGDSVLAIFDDACAAVRTALKVQGQLASIFASVAEPQRMRFRIGLHQGEVMGKSDGTVYGDGVNIAARLEALAEAGGITASAAVAEATRGQDEVYFVDQGEQLVKNIPYPVHAYRWVTADRRTPPGAVPHAGKPTSHPSIAVLPFVNLSADPEQAYFAEGIAEDLITALSRMRWLTVIARNSSFTYKGRAIDVREVGKSLGARYVLEGSVRKGGERVRVSCSLVDTSTGSQLWADRYDRELAETFDLQDEMTLTIAGTIEPELSKAEQERVRRKPVDNLDAWDLFQRGMWHYSQFTLEGHAESRRLLQQAVLRDPQFAPALSYLALSHYSSFFNRLDADANSLVVARDLALRALAIDNKQALARFVLGRIHTVTGQIAAALDELQSAIQLNPSLALAHYGRAAVLLQLGRGEEALESAATAERLSPHDPSVWAFQSTRALALSLGGRPEEAEPVARKAVHHPAATFWAIAGLASILGHLGREAEGREAIAQLVAKRPDFSMAMFRRVYAGARFEGQRNAGPSNLTRHFFEGLYKAGLPLPEPVEPNA
ncbi:MAG: adenylate/guanylate cyclase domain-containing protein [Rhodoferax sp.]